MKLKRILAAALAGVMAITSSVVTSFTASAADTVYTVYEFEPGVISSASFSSEAVAALNAATSSLSVTVDAVGDGYFYLQETSTWKCTSGNNPTVAIDTSHEFWSNFKVATGVNIAISGYTKVNKITVSVDGGSAITVFDVSTAPAGMDFPAGGTNYVIQPATLTAAGVTADNIADCTLNATIVTAGTSKEIAVLASDGSNWVNQFFWKNDFSAGVLDISLDYVAGGSTVSPLDSALLFHGKDIVVSKFTLTVPETVTTYAVTLNNNSEHGIISFDDGETDDKLFAENETVTIVDSISEEGYELDGVTVTAEDGSTVTVTETADGYTFTMPAKAVMVTPTFKAADDGDVLETGTYSDGTWAELSADDLVAAGTLNTITTVGDEYLTTTNVLSIQYSTTEKKLRIYQVYSEADLAGKTSASIVVKKGDVGLKLTTDCVYTTLADGQTAPEGCYYIAWVISGVDDPTEFSYSYITLA